MEKDDFYTYILQIGIKEKKSTNKKYIKERLKMAMQNRIRNVTMAEVNKTTLTHFP